MTDEEFLRYIAKIETMSTGYRVRLRNIASAMERMKKNMKSENNYTYTSTKTIKPEIEENSDVELKGNDRVVVPAEVFMKKYKNKMKEN